MPACTVSDSRFRPRSAPVLASPPARGSHRCQPLAPEGHQPWPALAVGGDPHCCDLTRILRLPGYTNHKPPAAPVRQLKSSLNRRFPDSSGRGRWWHSAPRPSQFRIYDLGIAHSPKYAEDLQTGDFWELAVKHLSQRLTGRGGGGGSKVSPISFSASAKDLPASNS